MTSSGIRKITWRASPRNIDCGAFPMAMKKFVATIWKPNTLTAVEAYAFCGCSALTSVTIPASVREIGETAFSGCGLTSVTLPKGLKKLGTAAFSGNALTSITLPDALEEMGTSVVSGCEDLTTITFPKTGKLAESMKGMTANQFMNYLGQCPSLKDVVNLPSEQLAGRLETFRALFEGVDPSRWVTEIGRASCRERVWQLV